VIQRAIPVQHSDRDLAGGAGEMLCSRTSVSQGTECDSDPLRHSVERLALSDKRN